VESQVTVCITSFNRPKLLERTIESLLALTQYPFADIFVLDDSGKPQKVEQVCKRFGDRVTFGANKKTIGQVQSIDELYARVKTPYIFHCEDDYFFEGNERFIEESIELLEKKTDIHQVWIRHFDNYWISHGEMFATIVEEGTEMLGEIGYAYIRNGHYGNWCGFSFNPGLRRLKDYHTMFPNGYAEFEDPKGLDSELFCNNHVLQFNYRAVLLDDGACYNMGHYKSSYSWKRRFNKWFKRS
jgi:glycosyltransferase involved in cell wall biosynthesis